MQRSPQVWDCVFLNDEIDVLRFRLQELNSVIDRFVIVESDLTFTGRSKPIASREHHDVLAPYEAKIAHVTARLSSNAASPWQRENEQRAALRAALGDGDPGDVLLVGDVDEIPSRDVVEQLRAGISEPVRLELVHSTYFANWILKSPWLDGPIACRRSQIDSPLAGEVLEDARPNATKLTRSQPVIRSAGHHLANLEGAAGLMRKFDAYSHQEYNTARNRRFAHLERCIAYGVYFTGRDMLRRLAPSELDPLLTRLQEFRPGWFNFDPPPAWVKGHAYCGYTWLRQARFVPDALVDTLDEHPDVVTGPGAPLFAGIDSARRALDRLGRRASGRSRSALTAMGDRE